MFYFDLLCTIKKHIYHLNTGFPIKVQITFFVYLEEYFESEKHTYDSLDI